jgi:hypothetical protein
MTLSRLIVASLLLCLTTVSFAEDKEKWTPLFDGKTLDGWTQRGGKAKYAVENGEIVGSSVPNTANSFLCTNKDYGNFILELEFKVDPALNSGVQIRSEYLDKAREVEYMGKTVKEGANRVFGYQCEIDPSARAWSGGIYDEGRRGWLNDLKNNEAAQKAFKQKEWNKFRIECSGDSMQRRFDQDLDQRRTRRRSERRPHPQGLHRLAGAWRRRQGRAAGSPLAEHPDSGEVVWAPMPDPRGGIPAVWPPSL